ncbi:preprotein translocase subunit YajC [Lutibacter oceani]|uniref:Sec translocon accessory complex subunit YajC n=1 Tax=Lutibacter oceani TaxID=1853311 RepID=A0A3D9RWB8_9FLAO|nr:preprotein translocase subunit YajC [Lutibacter oceani]REE82061.1 preprotein translocase subunit YajC [Lutibacter oceani]
MYTTILLQTGGGSSLTSMLPFLLMFVVIYFFMIRPQMKKAKNEKAFQSSIAKGNKIVTSSGIHGKIVDIVDSDNTVIVETGAGKIKFERSAISMDLSKKYSAPADKK